MAEKKPSKKFEPYPTRNIRMSDETWNKLKKEKLKSERNWDKFILKLIEK